MDNEKRSGQSRGDAAFKLHYFPEIPAEFEAQPGQAEPLNNEPQASSHGDFQKIETLYKDLDQQGMEEMEIEAQRAAQMQEMMDRAFQQGYAKGLEEGKKTEREKLTPCVQGIEKIFRDIENVKQLLIQEAETAVMKLALNIAGKVLQTESAVRPETILPIASAALGKVMDHNRITLRINPGDLALLEQHNKALQDITGSKEPLHLQADDDVSPGGCFIETDFGDIDARIESQLKAIEDALMSEWAQSGNGEQ